MLRCKLSKWYLYGYTDGRNSTPYTLIDYRYPNLYEPYLSKPQIKLVFLLKLLNSSLHFFENLVVFITDTK